VSFSDLGIQPDSPFNQFNSPLCSPRLTSNDSEEVQRIKMVWLPLQNLPIAALRVCQFPLLVQRHSLIELGLQ
jgi:hypothetical protein